MKAKLVGSAFCFLMILGTLKASTITVAFDSQNTPWGQVSLQRGGLVYDTYPHAGKFLATTDISGLPSVFDTYCIDLLHAVYLDEAEPVDGISLMSNWRQDNLPDPEAPFVPTPIAWPWANNPLAGRSAAYLYSTFRDGASADLTAAAALQIAIWEVLYEGGDTGTVEYDLASGSISFSDWDPSVINVANGYLVSLENKLSVNPDLNGVDALWIITSNDSPDVYRAYNQDFIAPIPEPGTLVLLLSGVVAVGGIALKRRS